MRWRPLSGPGLLRREGLPGDCTEELQRCGSACPLLELLPGLADEHGQAVDGLQTACRGVFQERREQRAVDTVCYDAGGGKSRVTWIADVLPEPAAATFQQMMTHGLSVMSLALGR